MFSLERAQIRMVDESSGPYRKFAAFKFEGLHPNRETIQHGVFIFIILPSMSVLRFDWCLLTARGATVRVHG